MSFIDDLTDATRTKQMLDYKDWVEDQELGPDQDHSEAYAGYCGSMIDHICDMRREI